MRIGLNLLYLIPDVVGGTQTYATGLIGGLRQLQTHYAFTLFVNREGASLFPDEGSHFQKVICPVDAKNRLHRYWFEQVRLRDYVRSHSIDLLHSLAYISPIFLPCPAVVTIHDLNFKMAGHAMPLIRRWALGLFVRQAIKRSERILTVSEFSRQEIFKAYNVAPDKVIVTHEAADDALPLKKTKEPGQAQAQQCLNKPYIVAFSSVTANKNIPRLVEAFNDAKNNGALEHQLVLIGHPPLNGNGAPIRIHPDIIWTGYLGREDVYDVLSHADFMVFPSLYEGFGLPLLEAMAAGVPVVCSNAASIPEVTGGAAVYFDPLSVPDLTGQLLRVARDPALRLTLKDKGVENLKRFSWKKTAAETVAIYDDILSGGSCARRRF